MADPKGLAISFWLYAPSLWCMNFIHFTSIVCLKKANYKLT